MNPILHVSMEFDKAVCGADTGGGGVDVVVEVGVWDDAAVDGEWRGFR